MVSWSCRFRWFFHSPMLTLGISVYRPGLQKIVHHLGLVQISDQQAELNETGKLKVAMSAKAKEHSSFFFFKQGKHIVEIRKLYNSLLFYVHKIILLVTKLKSHLWRIWLATPKGRPRTFSFWSRVGSKRTLATGIWNPAILSHGTGLWLYSKEFLQQVMWKGRHVKNEIGNTVKICRLAMTMAVCESSVFEVCPTSLHSFVVYSFIMPAVIIIRTNSSRCKRQLWIHQKQSCESDSAFFFSCPQLALFLEGLSSDLFPPQVLLVRDKSTIPSPVESPVPLTRGQARCEEIISIPLPHKLWP